MTGELNFEQAGQEYKITNDRSAYQPSEEVRDLTFDAKREYEQGDRNLNQQLPELNGMSILQANDEYQRNWLSWSPPPSDDPDEDWRWTGVRPLTRNKIVSTAAHLTQSLNAPAAFAQNDRDEEDSVWGEVAELLLEYNIQNSDYEESFLYGVISGLVNVLSYFTVDYAEGYQTVWDGKERKDVVDDESSGFQYGLAPCDEMLFSSLWTFRWQLQDFNIRRQRVPYELAKGLYGKSPNFGHVTPGIKSVLGEDGIFYDVEDFNGDMVEVVRRWHRRSDCEVVFVNGIYVGNENAGFNPFVHRTNKDKPKYPVVKYGAEPIDAKRFVGYKSLAAKMMNDQELVDRQWQLSFDASFMQTFAPTIITNTGKVDLSVMAPAAVTSLEADAKVYPLNSSFNASAAFQALHEAERSANESSPDPQLAGKTSTGDLPSTARQSLLIQQNAETNLGLIGRMICGVMVKEIGELMLDDIIRHQTVGEVSEIVAGVPRMKFRSFLVPGRKKDGSTKTALVRLTDRLSGTELTPDEEEMENVGLAEEAGDGREIWEVNPGMFSRLSFRVSVDYQAMMRRNTPFERSFKLAAYDKAIADPNIARDPEASAAVTRDFLLEPVVGGDASKYLPKRPAGQSLVPPAPGQEQQAAPAGGGQDIPSRFVRAAAMESGGGRI
jgi:hypothetical protein